MEFSKTFVLNIFCKLLWDIHTSIQVAAWNYKSFIAKDFDENTLKMKAASPIQVIKNKEKRFQLSPDQARFLILHLFLFECLIGREIKTKLS